MSQCHTVTKKRNFSETLSSSNLNDSFLCSICQSYIVLPTSLICGHSFCKFCVVEWIETSSPNDDHASCPVCRKKVCFADIESIGINKVLESCIDMFVRSLSDNDDTKSYKQRQKKMKKREHLHNFVQNHKKTQKFKTIRLRMNEILKNCNGVMKYDEMVENLKSLDFDKTYLDLFLSSKVKKNTGLILVGDYIVDCWTYDNIQSDTQIGKYLLSNPKELLYVVLHDGISENSSDLIQQYLLPQSDFFKGIVDEKKAKKALYIKYNSHHGSENNIENNGESNQQTNL